MARADFTPSDWRRDLRQLDETIGRECKESNQRRQLLLTGVAMTLVMWSLISCTSRPRTDPVYEEALAYGDFTPHSNTASGYKFTTSTPAWFTYDRKFYTMFAHLLGVHEGLHLVQFNLTNPSRSHSQRVLVKLSLDHFAAVSMQEIELEPGETRFIEMEPSFDLGAIRALRNPTPTEAKLLIVNEFSETTLFTEKIILEPPNRIRWNVPSYDGTKMVDMRRFVSLMVTPADRDGHVHELIREASELMPSRSMAGYQHGTQHVIDQFSALYIALQKRGYNYTSISENYFDHTQRIRLPSESLADNSGNCIDASLVMASALEALGLDPIIVFMTGHAFVGVAIQQQPRVYMVVETTMIKSASFKEAMNHASDLSDSIQKDDPNFLLVDIKDARSKGWLPIHD